MWIVLFLVILIGFSFWLYGEKKSSKKKDSTEAGKQEAAEGDEGEAGKQEAAEGDEGVLDPEEGVFGEVTYVRSVYEGEDE